MRRRASLEETQGKRKRLPRLALSVWAFSYAKTGAVPEAKTEAFPDAKTERKA